MNNILQYSKIDGVWAELYHSVFVKSFSVPENKRETIESIFVDNETLDFVANIVESEINQNLTKGGDE